MNYPILITVLVAYFAAMVGIGLKGKKNYGSTFDSKISANRTAGVWLFMGGAVGAHIGNGFVVGSAGDSAALGLTGACYGLACAMSYLVILLINNKVYETGCITLPGYLRARYNDETIVVLNSVIHVIKYVANIGVQLMAGKALFVALGLPGELGVLILLLVVLAYSTLSGLWGTMATSVIQTVVIVVGLVIATIYIVSTGGLDLISAQMASGTLPADFTKLFPTSKEFTSLLISGFTMGLGMMADQCMIQRVCACKSARHAMGGWIFSVVVLAAAAFMPALCGMYGRAMFGETGNAVFFRVVIEIFPSLMGAIMIAAVLAAIMSSCDAFLVGISTIVCNDIYRSKINPNADEKVLNRLDFICTALAAAAAAIIALYVNSIVGMLFTIVSFSAATCFAPFIGGLLWKRGTAKAAWISTIVGAVFVGLYVGGVLVTPLKEILAAIIAIIVYVIVSLLEGKKETAAA